jgi:hypothetical protein
MQFILGCLGIFLAIALIVWLIKNILWVGGIAAAILGILLWIGEREQGNTTLFPPLLIAGGITMTAGWFMFYDYWPTIIFFSAISFLVSLIALIIHLIKKNPIWKRWSFGMAASLLLLGIAGANYSPEQQKIAQETTAQPAEQKVKVILDNKEMDFSIPAVYKEKRVLVPFREFHDDLKLASTWDATEKKVSGGRCGAIGTVKADSMLASLNNKPVTLDVYPENIEDREVRAPVRFTADVLKLKVEKWDEPNLTVYLSSTPCGAAVAPAAPKKSDDKDDKSKEEKKQDKPVEKPEKKPDPTPQPPKETKKEPAIVEEPTYDLKQDFYFGSCKEAKAAGVAPLYRGDPGYRPGLDRDGDGKACE